MESPTTLTPLDLNPAEKSGELTVFDPSKALELDAIEALRAKQFDAYKETKFIYQRNGLSDAEMQQVTHDSVANTVNNYLYNQGLDITDPRYDEFRNALNDLSITSSHESTWNKKNVTNPAESGQARAEAYYQRLVNGVSTYVNTDGNTVEVEAGLDDAAELDDVDSPETEEPTELDTLRCNLAELSANRQRHIGGKGGEEYQQALSAYNEELIARGKEELYDVLNDDTLDETEKNKKVIEYLFKEQNKLRTESLAAVKDSKKSKMIDWFAKKMDAQTQGGRIAKALFFGGILGGATAITLGLGGGLVAALGVGVVAGTARFTKAYAMREAKAGRGLGFEDESVKQSILEDEANSDVTSDDAFEQFQAQLNQNFEDDIKKEQHKRRKSVAIAMGTVAAGAVFGSVAHIAVDAMGDIDIFSGFGNNGSASVESSAVDTAVDHGDSTVGEIADFSGNGVSDGSEFADVTTPTETADIYGGPDSSFDSSTVETDTVLLDPNFSVDYGEGGIHFFQDLGLTEANWYEAQGELLQQFPNDFYSMGDGQVGLLHQGPLSIEAQEFIKDKFALAFTQGNYALAA